MRNCWLNWRWIVCANPSHSQPLLICPLLAAEWWLSRTALDEGSLDPPPDLGAQHAHAQRAPPPKTAPRSDLRAGEEFPPARQYDRVLQQRRRAGRRPDGCKRVRRVLHRPGVNHCFGGTGADRVDLIGPILDWVEKGTRPSSAGVVPPSTFAPSSCVPQPRGRSYHW